MKLQTTKKIIGLAITAALMSACASPQKMTENDSDEAFAASSTASAAATKTNHSPNSATGGFVKVAKNASPQMGARNTDCGNHQFNSNGNPEDSVKIRVTGYGAPPKAFYPDPQRRLMAMRAAKIDAYRSLAERVTGIQIWGGTTIGDMVVEKDRFRVYIDTFIYGARVIAENPLDDGTFETIVELMVDQTFLQQTLPEKANNDCMMSSVKPVFQIQSYVTSTDTSSMTKSRSIFQNNTDEKWLSQKV